MVAVLATDVVGFQALARQAPERARDVRERQVRLLRQFNGELMQASGDEALAVFDSPLRAMDCSIALQAALRDARGLRLRVGIHLGEVVVREGAVSGEGVEVAEQICRLSDPGGIAASSAVWDRVKQQSYLVGRRLGARELGLAHDEPAEIFTVSLRPASSAH